MYIVDDGIKLNAILDMPEGGAEKCPLCLVFHGFTGHIEEDHIVAERRRVQRAQSLQVAQ